MQSVDFNRLLAVLSILIALGISPTAILMFVIGYLLGQARR
jgi:hypothetical protein